MLELQNVTITMKNEERTLVENLSFTLSRGDRAVLIGSDAVPPATDALAPIERGRAIIPDALSELAISPKSWEDVLGADDGAMIGFAREELALEKGWL